MNSSLFLKAISSSVGALTWPYRLNFLMSKECHSRCQNCNIWKVVPENELQLGEIATIAKNFPFLNWLSLTGGEPTDRKEIVEIAEIFLEHNPNLAMINFSTNGLNTARITNVVDGILRLGVPKFVVSVSIDGPPEVNDEIRGIPGDFSRATETLRQLRKKAGKGFDVFASMTIYEKNQSLVRETFSAIQSHVPGFKQESFHINIGHNSFQAYENNEQNKKTIQNLDSLESFNRSRKLSFQMSSAMEKIFHRAALDYLRQKRSPLKCAALSASLFLTEKGIVYPCSIWNNPLGNVRDFGYDLKELLSAAAAKVAREEIKKMNCPNCWSPCEAYQSIASSPLGALKYLAKSL